MHSYVKSEERFTAYFLSLVEALSDGRVDWRHFTSEQKLFLIKTCFDERVAGCTDDSCSCANLGSYIERDAMVLALGHRASVHTYLTFGMYFDTLCCHSVIVQLPYDLYIHWSVDRNMAVADAGTYIRLEGDPMTYGALGHMVRGRYASADAIKHVGIMVANNVVHLYILGTHEVHDQAPMDMAEEEGLEAVGRVIDVELATFKVAGQWLNPPLWPLGKSPSLMNMMLRRPSSEWAERAAMCNDSMFARVLFGRMALSDSAKFSVIEVVRTGSSVKLKDVTWGQVRDYVALGEDELCDDFSYG